MLKPIPAKILTHSATLKVCSEIDAWQNPTFTDVALKRINIQPTHSTVMNKDNTQTTLNSVAFIDARISEPENYDFEAAQILSESNGSPLHLIYNNRDYVVVLVDTLCDDTGAYHHTELGLV